jgi:hypothetical protein
MLLSVPICRIVSDEGGPVLHRPHFPGGQSHGERPFRKGVFKYIVLQHLKDKPCHAYESICALEDRLQSLYIPSLKFLSRAYQGLEDILGE